MAVFANDIHSFLNKTSLGRIERPCSVEGFSSVIRQAGVDGDSVCIAGGRHAMGGQQFAEGGTLADTSAANRIIGFDASRGMVQVEAGIQWPEFISSLESAQKGNAAPWGIVQKQTGADRMSIGGTISANAHGRGLRFHPIVQDVESLSIINAEGEPVTCDREKNADIFQLVIGGYGLFGIIYSAVLKLAPRRQVKRVVELKSTETVMEDFKHRIDEGFLYGDFQFSTDEKSEGFMRDGVFSCYQPVDTDAPAEKGDFRSLSEDNWKQLIWLGHTDKAAAFKAYSEFYLSTSGQLYWNDTHQLSTYVDDYHKGLDRRLGVTVPGSEVITELYVPRSDLYGFMEAARALLQQQNANLIYGTVRLIEQDDETFLNWAKLPYACIILNLHVDHSEQKRSEAADTFRELVDLAADFGGSYFLTYHRYAKKEQLERCYPQFERFLELKLQHDPKEVFQSNWYRHYKAMFE